MSFESRLIGTVLEKREAEPGTTVGAPVFDEPAPADVPAPGGAVNPFPMLGYIDSAETAPPMPTSLDPNAPRRIPGMNGTPKPADGEHLRAFERRRAAEKLLTTKQSKDLGTDAQEALTILTEIAPDQRGAMIDKLGNEAFENLVGRIGAGEQEKFAQLLEGTTNPERKLRLWAGAHKGRAINDIGRKKGDVGADDAAIEYQRGRLTSELSKDEQEKADEAFDEAYQGDEHERTGAQQKNLARHQRRVNQVTHTKDEVDREVAALLAKAKGGTLDLAQVDALRERKDLEYGVEAKHGIDLTAEHFDDPKMAEFSREWTKEDLQTIDLTLGRLPDGHVHNLDGLEELHRKPNYHFMDSTGGLHSNGTIDITDWGRSPSAGFRHGGDKREGVSDAFREAHGDKISTLEFVLTHEIGHDVADTHAKEFEKFKTAAGWQQVKADALTKDNVTATDQAELEKNREDPNAASSTIGGDERTYSPEKGTTDSFWAVDRTAIPSAKESAKGPKGEDTWAYARVNPQEHFAEMYAKAVHVPHKLHDEMVARPAAEATAARESVEATKRAIEAVDDRPQNRMKLQKLRTQLAASMARAEDAERAVKQRGDQFSVMRNDVFKTDKAVTAARARLASRNVGADQLRAFEQQAAALSTPEQISVLEQGIK